MYPNEPWVYDREYYRGNPRYMKNKFRHMCYAAVCMQLEVGSVLDIGCGHGYMVEILKQLGTVAVGLDFSEHAKCDVRGSAVALPFRSKAFDLVVSTDLLEHLPESEVHTTIEECKRVAWRQAHFYCPAELTDEHGYGYHLTMQSYEWWLDTFSQHGLGVSFLMEARMEDDRGMLSGYSYLLVF